MYLVILVDGRFFLLAAALIWLRASLIKLSLMLGLMKVAHLGHEFTMRILDK